MNLFDWIELDERIIVLSSEEDQILITWNRSCTLQMWGMKTSITVCKVKAGYYDLNLPWEELSVRTLESEPKDYAAARAKALEWVAMFSNHSEVK